MCFCCVVMTTGHQVWRNKYTREDSIFQASEASSLSIIKDIVQIIDARLFQSVQSLKHEFHRNLVRWHLKSASSRRDLYVN